MASLSWHRRQSPTFWLAAALPLLAYVGGIGFAEAKRRDAPRIELKIEGYDPRDPFRGRYLRYRIAVEHRGGALGHPSQACAGASAPRVRPVYLHDGAAPPGRCEFELPIEFVEEEHRSYVQQDRGRELEEAVQAGRASVRLRVVNPGEVLVEALLVDGRPVR